MTKRLIDLKTLLSKVPFSRAHIYRLEAKGAFPRRIRIGDARVAWIESEVENWIQQKADSQRPDRTHQP